MAEQAADSKPGGVKRRTPSSPSSREDFWSTLPASLMGYAHVVGEAIVPLAPKALTPLTAVTMAYVAMSSIDRGNKTAQLEPHTELRQYNGFAAAFESAFREWVSLITLPSLALGALGGPAASLLKATGASPQLVRYGPSAASLALLPLLLPACRAGTEAVMEFAVAPTIESNRPLARPRLGPRPDYVPPSPEELLGLGGVAAELDEEDRAKLKWALDGDPSSPYPEEVGTSGRSGGGRAGSGGGGGAAKAAAAPTPEEDAVFLQSLQQYAARIEAGRQRKLGQGVAGEGAGAAAASAPAVSDYDLIVAAAVDTVSGGLLSRTHAAAAAAAAADAASSASAGSAAPPSTTQATSSSEAVPLK